MFDSLPYRNDAATVFRRLIRSLPTRSGVLGVATCDKGLPAMMMALAATRDLPCRADSRRRHPARRRRRRRRQDPVHRRPLRPRPDHARSTLPKSCCRACASPGGGCQFLGTAATSQVVGEALGMSLPHSALAPSGHPIWLDMARRSARAVLRCETGGVAHARHPHRRLRPQRHGGPRGLRRLDQPDPAPARHRPRRRTRAPHGGRLDARQPPGAAPRRRPPQRPQGPSHRAGLPRRRRPRSACCTSAAPACSTPVRAPSAA